MPSAQPRDLQIPSVRDVQRSGGAIDIASVSSHARRMLAEDAMDPSRWNSIAAAVATLKADEERAAVP